jgi:hypothetical protein
MLSAVYIWVFHCSLLLVQSGLDIGWYFPPTPFFTTLFRHLEYHRVKAAIFEMYTPTAGDHHLEILCVQALDIGHFLRCREFFKSGLKLQ